MPDKQIVAIDASILDSWDLCHKKYELQHIKLLAPAAKAKSLDQGSLMHLMLKHYYTLKKDPNTFDYDKAVKEALMIGYTTETNLSPVDTEEIINVVRGYFEKYVGENWIILEVEKAFAVSLYDSPDLQIIGQGICDLIVDSPTGLQIVDHKKRSRRVEDPIFNHQKLMYTTGLNIGTFTTNKLVFIKDPDRYQRQLNTYDEEQREEWLQELVMAVKEMIAFKQIGFYRRNPTSCDKYGGCVYQNFCPKTPSRRELMIGRDFFYGEQWDVGKVLEKE